MRKREHTSTFEITEKGQDNTACSKLDQSQSSQHKEVNSDQQSWV